MKKRDLLKVFAGAGIITAILCGDSAPEVAIVGITVFGLCFILDTKFGKKTTT